MRSAVGAIVAALAVRRERGLNAFTVLSCDNLPGNGDLSKAMVLGFLKAKGDSSLASWVETRATFPNTMVDRITPMTTASNHHQAFSDDVRMLVRETLGVDDDWPVIAETFSQVLPSPEQEYAYNL